MPDIKAEIAGAILSLLGYDGTDFRNLKVDADGHLQIDALSAALPPDAATETTLADVYTVLQTIDNLVNALVSVGTDHLLVEVDGSTLPTGAATAANQATEITQLTNIANLRAALNSIGTDELLTIVQSSALPNGAATGAKQDTMITALQIIDNLANALGSVDADDLQVDVKTSALPSGAATSANQSTMITALQLIDDLRNALGSVNADDLQVDVKTSALPSGAATETTLDNLYDHTIIDPDWRYQGDNLVNVFGSVAVNSATWTTLCSYTVPSGKTAYIVGWSAGLYCANQMFSGLLELDSVAQCGGDCYNAPLIYQGTTIIKATQNQVVRVRGYHSAGSAQFMKGWINGWVQ